MQHIKKKLQIGGPPIAVSTSVEKNEPSARAQKIKIFLTTAHNEIVASYPLNSIKANCLKVKINLKIKLSMI
jgi:hypothetical protein